MSRFSPQVLRGLPRRQNTACFTASRAVPSVPPADLPSVRKIIVSSPQPFLSPFLSRRRCSLQSLSCGTRTETAAARSRLCFLIVLSWLRSFVVSSILAMSLSVSAGARWSISSMAFFICATNSLRSSPLPSFVFVCPSNTGSFMRIATHPSSPSRTSSPSNFFLGS